eukprot:CAMPEP_0170187980 /NCGR_PEP_ID=MMETSP0040_2-20121228/43109_1 /TAXON_ID=641309 /ORGANISM="Lotharella oceanica, Strain CCMP622" /LENGTH=309 /DNA_ID=CAMNT_0010435145 /DNA_START=371 /DNA_END=1297 /DNA_ORIENTATION=-
MPQWSAPMPANSSSVPDILILVSPGKGQAYDHRQWVDTVLDTWGGNLPNGVGMVFLHCTKVQNETTWCPPGRLLEFEAFVWALRHTLDNRAARRWIVRVQLGTYVILSNLIRYLSTFDSSLPHFLGHRIVTETTAFHEPPAGLALTFTAASLLTVSCAQIHRYSLPRSEKRESELAAALAKCSTESGVRISSTSTMDGQQRFNAHSALAPTPVPCAPESITFYHQSVTEARWLHCALTNRDKWAGMSPEARHRAMHEAWENATVPREASAESWGDWILSQLPPMGSDAVAEFDRAGFGRSLPADDSAVW